MTRSPIALGSSVVEDDDPTAEDAETITPDELDDLLDDGTPTRVVVLRQPGSGFAVASVTLAVSGIGLGLVPIRFPGAAVVGVLAIVYGALGRRKGRDGRGLATAGLVLGVLSVAVAVVGGVLVLRAVDWARGEIDDLDAEIEKLKDEIEAEVEEKASEIEADIRAEIEAIVEEIVADVEKSIEAQVGGVADEVKVEVEAQVETITDELKAEIQLRFDELRVEIDDVKRRVDALG